MDRTFNPQHRLAEARRRMEAARLALVSEKNPQRRTELRFELMHARALEAQLGRILAERMGQAS